MSAAASSIQAGLLQAILDEPAADDLRLIYADWLEEHGEPERAEFIRVQVKLAKCDPEKTRYWSDRWPSFRHREKELLQWEWEKPFWLLFGHPDNLAGPPFPGFTWHRGFIVAVRCPLADWTVHGPTLVRATPLERVTLTDKQPLSLAANTTPADPWYGWYTWNDQRLQINTVDQNDRRIRIHRRFVPAAYDLPTDLLTLVPGQRIESNPYTTYHPSAGDALDALSVACLAWAKAQPAL